MILTGILIASYIVGSWLTWLTLRLLVDVVIDAGQAQDLAVLGPASSRGRTCSVLAVFWPAFWVLFTVFIAIKIRRGDLRI